MSGHGWIDACRYVDGVMQKVVNGETLSAAKVATVMKIMNDTIYVIVATTIHKKGREIANTRNVLYMKYTSYILDSVRMKSTAYIDGCPMYFLYWTVSKIVHTLLVIVF